MRNVSEQADSRADTDCPYETSGLLVIISNICGFPTAENVIGVLQLGDFSIQVKAVLFDGTSRLFSKHKWNMPSMIGLSALGQRKVSNSKSSREIMGTCVPHTS